MHAEDKLSLRLPSVCLCPALHFDYNEHRPLSGALFDFGLYFFHNVFALMKRGTAPYFYVAKLESHLEARLWNDVFVLAQRLLGVPVGTIRCRVEARESETWGC